MSYINVVGPGSCRAKVDAFVPHTQHVNLRIVGQPPGGYGGRVKTNQASFQLTTTLIADQ